MNHAQDDALPQTWKRYLLAGLVFLAIFYVATFSLGILFLHRGQHWQLPGLVIGVLYLLIIIFSAMRMIKKLSMPAIMVAAPTIPLCMLLIVVSLLPTLQILDKRGQPSQNKESSIMPAEQTREQAAAPH